MLHCTMHYPFFTMYLTGHGLYTCITLSHLMLSNVLHFFTLCFTGHGQQEDLYGHDDGSCQKPETQAVYFSHSTEHKISINILMNILGMFAIIILKIVQLEERISAPVCQQ